MKCIELRSLTRVEGRLGDRKMGVRNRNQSTPVVPSVIPGPTALASPKYLLEM